MWGSLLIYIFTDYTVVEYSYKPRISLIFPLLNQKSRFLSPPRPSYNSRTYYNVIFASFLNISDIQEKLVQAIFLSPIVHAQIRNSTCNVNLTTAILLSNPCSRNDLCIFTKYIIIFLKLLHGLTRHHCSIYVGGRVQVAMQYSGSSTVWSVNC